MYIHQYNLNPELEGYMKFIHPVGLRHSYTEPLGCVEFYPFSAAEQGVNSKVLIPYTLLQNIYTPLLKFLKFIIIFSHLN